MGDFLNQDMKGIDKKLDDAWSKLVKLRAGNRCEYCGKTSPLNSHHIFSRSKRSTRWDVQNGVCLCVGHHTFSSTFSAHKTPLEFVDWLTRKKGESFIMKLRVRANALSKLMTFEKEILLQELKKEIEAYD
jgi:hypothetical protein